MEYSVRLARKEEVEKMAEIEAVCFPPAEAASVEDFKERYEAFPECFIVAEANNQVVGVLSGCLTDKPELPDELYHNVKLHKPDGAYQTVFGLIVHPDYQHHGIASALVKEFIRMNQERGKKGIVLTCKNHMIPFYERLGFVFQGVSESTHGGAVWNDMLLLF